MKEYQVEIFHEGKVTLISIKAGSVKDAMDEITSLLDTEKVGWVNVIEEERSC